MTKRYCRHERCRLEVITALGWLTPLLKGDEARDAIHAAQAGEVPCRIHPRPGAVDAPFPDAAEADD